LVVGEVGVHGTVTVGETSFAPLGNPEANVVVVTNPDFSDLLTSDIPTIHQEFFGRVVPYFDLAAVHYQPPLAFAARACLTLRGG
jgi:hypothetical protein